METTIHFEKNIPTTNENAEAVPDKSVLTEIYVTSFSGEDRLYLHLTDSDGKKMSLLIDKKTAQSFKAGLDNAMSELGY